jgi:hypothetical protein
MATEIYNKIVSKDISDTLSLVGIVVIENGENKVIGRNHWVGQGLETIGSYLIGGASNGAASNIYIGSDTLIPTTVSLVGLISPIGSSPGTAPNIFNVSYSINLSSTIPATVVYNAVWNAGTVSGTLGEVGLYLKGYGGLSGSTYATNPGLGARMAAADGAFTPFVINTSVALNVSWFIRFVYSSGTSVTQYITNPSLSGDPSQQPIVSITNSQSTPVPAGLQVVWQVPVSSLQAYFNRYGINLNSNLSNMRILYNGQYVPAWIQSINNGIATIWMKTPVSIPANSSISLSLNAGPSFNFDGVYWGEAPQLSPTYAQYDNGANVFNNYWNFVGTSLPSPWLGSGYTVNNGVTFSNGIIYLNMNTVFGSNYNVLVGGYLKSTVTGNGYVALGFQGQPWQSGAQAIGWVAESTYVLGNWYSGSNPPPVTTYYTSSVSTSNFVTLELYSTSSSNTVAWVNGIQATASYGPAGNYIRLGFFGTGTAGSGILQYAYTRTFPPNGVMPSVSLL